MNDNVVDFVGLAVQRLLLPVLRVVLPEVHLGDEEDGIIRTWGAKDYRDLAQLCSVDTMGSGGDVPVVEENASTLVRRDSYVHLRERRNQEALKVKVVQEWVNNGHDDKVGSCDRTGEGG